MCHKKKPVMNSKMQTGYLRQILLFLTIFLAAGIYGSYHLLEHRMKNTAEKETQIRVEITFDEWRSELPEPDQCFLCGNSNRSRIGYYRNWDTIGLISLNDWTIVDFQLNDHENREETESTSDPGFLYRSTGEITCFSSGNPSRGMARVRITLKEGYQPDSTFIRQNLCQYCLDKVASSLHFWKWEAEEKQAIPLCLVDFQTLEIYSLQDWYQAYFIRDYWVELDFEETTVSVKAYYLPERDTHAHNQPVTSLLSQLHKINPQTVA